MVPLDQRDVAIALHVLRIVRGHSQKYLAEISNVRGSSISDYERAKKAPGLRVLSAILAAMGYRYQDLDDTLVLIRRLRSAPPEEPG